MTVKIEIMGEDAGHALRELKGLSVGLLAFQGTREAVADLPTARELPVAPEQPVTFTGDTEVQTGGTTTEAPKRERGKPAPGRARRTKEEIAEDEAADKADAEAAAARGNISTDPENRVDPEDDPEVQAQDAADEQAEVDANRDAEAPLTVEDLKAVMSQYVEKFGMPATQEDGVKIFADAIGTPPAGEAAWKMTLVAAAGQDKLKAAIAAWKAAASAAGRYGA
jgi:hypothetical protein